MGVQHRQAGPLLDELGVKLEMDDNDRVSEVLVIAKTTDLETGEVGLVLASNDLDWIAHRGLISAAMHVSDSGDVERTNPED